MEFNGTNLAIFTLEHFLRVEEWHELATLMLGRISLFGHCSHVLDTLAECDKNTSSTTSKRRCRTIKSGITSTKDNHIAVELGKLRLTRTHA